MPVCDLGGMGDSQSRAAANIFHERTRRIILRYYSSLIAPSPAQRHREANQNPNDVEIVLLYTAVHALVDGEVRAGP